MNKYEVRYICSNCGHDFHEQFEKGRKAPATIGCPECGCFTAGKAWKKPDRIGVRDFIRFPKFHIKTPDAWK